MSLKDSDWDNLLESIEDKKCTPFIGEGASASWLQLGKDLASKWAKDHDFPLEDSSHLSRVAQFLAIANADNNSPKQFVRKYLEKSENQPPNFSLEKNRNKPYAVLADLHLPIYITTNYDLFMEAALKSRGKDPVSEFCTWNRDLRDMVKAANIPSFLDKGIKYRPTESNPLVYHLYGIYSLRREYRPNDKEMQNDNDISQSMVLTEKDYIDFIININQEAEKFIFPSVIREALTLNSLLFIGYSLDDMSFRVIFQGVIRMRASIRKTSIGVQLPPKYLSDNTANQVIKYLDQYTDNLFKVHVYWGDVSDFSKELRRRWDNYKSK